MKKERRESAPPPLSEISLELTLLMPCLNEGETIRNCVSRAKAALEKYGIHGEVLVADNGSDDGSPEIARAAGARVIHVSTRGYGAALRAGIGSARSDSIIMADADDSYDWTRIDLFLDKLREGHDLVMGCRLPRGGGQIEPGAMPFLHRWIGNPVLSFIGRLLFHSSITDFHCGMRAFSKPRIEQLGLVTTGMEFASEMAIKSELARLRIAEVPITLHRDGRSRPPHLRTWHDGWRHLRFMLLHSPKWVFLFPGGAALAVGLLGFAGLFLPPNTALGSVFNTRSLIACSFLVITGFQWISFGLSARIFGTTHGLLPPDRILSSLFPRITLETGCAIGIAIMSIGLAMVFFADFILPDTTGNGLAPDAEISLRAVILAATLVTLGIQVVLTSFFFSMLGLKYDPPAVLS